MKTITQMEMWNFIVEKHNTWSKPSYYNHVREVVKLVEDYNDIKFPIESVWKLDKRYKKLRLTRNDIQ